jgi:phosphoserine phosphatase
MLFQDALKGRLDLIQPSRGELDEFIASSKLRLTDKVADVVAALHTRGAHVYLVSGGFRQMIEPLADTLNIPHHRIYANDLQVRENKFPRGSPLDYVAVLCCCIQL